MAHKRNKKISEYERVKFDVETSSGLKKLKAVNKYNCQSIGHEIIGNFKIRLQNAKNKIFKANKNAEDNKKQVQKYK